MKDIVVNTNKEFALKAVKDQLETFTNAIYKKNDEIKHLWEMIREYQIELAQCKKEKAKLARTYAKKIGVLK